MRIVEKWDCETHKYNPHEIPDEWKISTYEADMNTPINCASCGKPITYGNSYTSRFIHTPVGFAYMVCDECLEKERAIESAAWKEGEE